MSRRRFDGKVVLVTGGSRGIGRATVLRFARAGAAVVVNYRRDEAAAEESVRDAVAAGASAIAVRADLEDGAAIAAMFGEVKRRFGGLDVLVANAAATAFRPILETKDHHVDRTFSITVQGFLRCVRAAAELMAGRDASIIAVSGFDSFRVIPGHGLLGAAKSAMETLVRYLAVELGPSGIRVNGVNPGFIETDSARFYAGDAYEARAREWAAATPVGRVAHPDEVASVIEFLASPDASFVVGQTIVADGGLTLR